jgi:PEP-CTERM motif
MYKLAFGIASGLVWSCSSMGQSVYIDFSDWEGSTTETYGAAAEPGVWNTYTTADDFPGSLLSTRGVGTDVTIAISGIGSGTRLFSANKPDTFGDNTATIKDYMYSTGFDMTIMLAGLENSVYRVYTYSVFDSVYSASNDTYVWVQGDSNSLQEIDGEWTGALEAGITHSLHNVIVTEGNLQIDLLGVTATINALQIVQIPAPSTLGLLAVGLAGVARQRR